MSTPLPVVPNISVTLGEQPDTETALRKYHAGRDIVADSLGHTNPPEGQICHLGLFPKRVNPWLHDLGMRGERITVFCPFENEVTKFRGLTHIGLAIHHNGLPTPLTFGDMIVAITGQEPSDLSACVGSVRHYRDLGSPNLGLVIPEINNPPTGLVVMLVYTLDKSVSLISAWTSEAARRAYELQARWLPEKVDGPSQTVIPLVGLNVTKPSYDSRRDQPLKSPL